MTRETQDMKEPQEDFGPKVLQQFLNTILAMLEPSHAVSQPSLETFKLAVVNKESQKNVLEYYKMSA